MTQFHELYGRFMDKTHAQLKELFPQVEKLEQLDDIEDLRLVGIMGMQDLENRPEHAIGAAYTATSPLPYSELKRKLAEAGVVRATRIREDCTTEKGAAYSMTMEYHGTKLEVTVSIYEPKTSNL